MIDVKLKFDYLKVKVEDGWLCIYDDENHILLNPKEFKKLLADINYTHCCTELKCSGCKKPLNDGLCGSCCSDLASGNY